MDVPLFLFIYAHCFILWFSVVFGPWYDHVKGWWEKKQTHSKLHYMFYEDLVEVN